MFEYLPIDEANRKSIELNHILVTRFVQLIASAAVTAHLNAIIFLLVQALLTISRGCFSM